MHLTGRVKSAVGVGRVNPERELVGGGELAADDGA